MAKKTGERQAALRLISSYTARRYGFGAGFLTGLFRDAGFAVFFLSLSRPPIKLRASAALKGNFRTEVSVAWPADFRVTSTRRLLASLMTVILARARRRSSVVRSVSPSIEAFTSSVVK